MNLTVLSSHKPTRFHRLSFIVRKGVAIMLVLSRKIGESIMVPELGITVAILAMQGNQVRLGISAPDDVSIYREEVWERLGGFLASTQAGPPQADKSRKRG